MVVLLIVLSPWVVFHGYFLTKEEAPVDLTKRHVEVGVLEENRLYCYEVITLTYNEDYQGAISYKPFFTAWYDGKEIELVVREYSAIELQSNQLVTGNEAIKDEFLIPHGGRKGDVKSYQIAVLLNTAGYKIRELDKVKIHLGPGFDYKDISVTNTQFTYDVYTTWDMDFYNQHGVIQNKYVSDTIALTEKGIQQANLYLFSGSNESFRYIPTGRKLVADGISLDLFINDEGQVGSSGYKLHQIPVFIYFVLYFILIFIYVRKKQGEYNNKFLYRLRYVSDEGPKDLDYYLNWIRGYTPYEVSYIYNQRIVVDNFDGVSQNLDKFAPDQRARFYKNAKINYKRKAVDQLVAKWKDLKLTGSIGPHWKEKIYEKIMKENDLVLRKKHPHRFLIYLTYIVGIATFVYVAREQDISGAGEAFTICIMATIGFLLDIIYVRYRYWKGKVMTTLSFLLGIILFLPVLYLNFGIVFGMTYALFYLENAMLLVVLLTWSMIAMLKNIPYVEESEEDIYKGLEDFIEFIRKDSLVSLEIEVPFDIDGILSASMMELYCIAIKGEGWTKENYNRDYLVNQLLKKS